jgi:AcrR family transcriptional regulator
MKSQKTYHHGDLKNALIEAGIEVLAREGIHGFSLRKAALRAEVSHSAPYAHFADKQGLIAAIASQGYRKILARLELAECECGQDTMYLFVRCAWEYIQFAAREPDHFKITFSGVVEKEDAYPELVNAAQNCFGSLTRIAARCQAEGILTPGPAEVAAVIMWGSIHGLATLKLDGQISQSLLEKHPWKELMLNCLGQLSRVPIPQKIIDSL